mgnify:CR=1 FL=1
MNTQDIFDQLWKEYAKRTPSAEKIKTLFTQEGNKINNDHVAFRTFDDPRIDISVLSVPFIEAGYEEIGDYHFPAKKLYAKHFEHKTDKNAPRVFISQLITSEFSFELRAKVKAMIDRIPTEELDASSLIFKGRLWGTPNHNIYQELLNETEYAAWLYVNGFCANHFTVNVNDLTSLNGLQAVNDYLKNNGFKMNTSGGEIKGTPALFLEQSSVLADRVMIDFEEGTKEVTSCYYEFAYRYPMTNGELYSGFVANSADKIFESTDMKLQEA